MRRILCVLLVAMLFLTSVVVAADYKTPTINKKPVSNSRIEVVEYSTDLLKGIQQRLGLLPKETAHAIIKGNKVLAVVPEDSKLLELQMHDECLKWQYGTKNYVVCEKRIHDQENMDYSKFPRDVVEVIDVEKLDKNEEPKDNGNGGGKP